MCFFLEHAINMPGHRQDIAVALLRIRQQTQTVWTDDQRKKFSGFSLDGHEGPAGSLRENREDFVFSIFYFKPTQAHCKECKTAK